MNMKKKVMRHLSALLIVSMVWTGSAFSTMASTARANEDEIIYDLANPDPNTCTVNVGETITLTAETKEVATASDAAKKATNSNALKTNMQWSVDNKSVATIEVDNSNKLECKVTGKEVGKAKVTAISSKGDFTSTKIIFEVTVSAGTSTDPSKPGTDDPSKPGTDDPSKPGTDDPSKPGADDPSSPVDSEPAEVESIKDMDETEILEKIGNLDNKALEGLNKDYDPTTSEGQKKIVAAVQESTQKVKDSLSNLGNTIVNKLKEQATKLQKTFNTISEKIPAVKNSKLNVSKAKNMIQEVAVDEDGKPVVVIPKMTYEIKLLDENNESLHEALKDNREPITFDVPLPKAGMHYKWEWALIKHNDHKFKSKIKKSGNDWSITIKAWNFSDFDLEFSEKEPTNVKNVNDLVFEDTTTPSTSGGSSSSGGGGSRSRVSSEVGSNASQNRYAMTGNWTSDANGWKFVKSNGETAANTWGWINNQYYYFDAAGKMVTGWTQVDGKWYYLNPTGTLQGAMLTGVIFDQASNAYFYTDASGAMVTGWQQINEKWYYFSPVSDGVYKLGQLLAGTYIDGYYLGADGAMVPAN